MRRIPALSVGRPWPTFIVDGHKPVENRTWTTGYRGPMWLHASNAWNGAALDFAWQLDVEAQSWDKADYPTGILALVDLVDVCNAHLRRPAEGCLCGLWAAMGQYHWRVENVRPLPGPVPCKGSLGLWYPNGDAANVLGEFAVTVGA